MCQTWKQSRELHISGRASIRYQVEEVGVVVSDSIAVKRCHGHDSAQKEDI